MEEKQREAGSPSPAAITSGGSSFKSESPATEPPPPRRRGQKRKSTSSAVSGSSSAPPKRHAREKAAAAAAAGISSLLPPIHNGPLTRARQLSDSNAAFFSAINAVKNQPSVAALPDAAAADSREKVNAAKEEYEALQAAIEAEFEAIQSRDSNAHVVPVAAGWFSWTSIHPIEKQALHSFFNGKSESRTPDVYMEIRNWIMKKFHANPSTNIELKDLLALTVGDSEAKQEVMEFLDHWGLINYHPFPQNDPANIDADPNTDGENTEKTDSLIEKLYQFENEQSFPLLVPRANMSSLAVPSGLFSESALTEELVKQEGPAVEYHCNSCSADCSRKRYHCQKQADFDLCAECYNNRKFGSGMCPSDFILMEPADVSGATGGKWTDQETLLLLEALELYKENWNEIAEHVATKTKAQCILHFLQMPIEDDFLDYDNTKEGLQEIAGPSSTNNDLSVLKDSSEPSLGKTSKDNSEPAESGSGKDNSEPSASKNSIEDPEPSERITDTNAAQPVSNPMETSNSEDAQSGQVTQDNGDEIVLKALKEAFDAVGCPLAPGDKLSFSEAGNAVMALAAFLTQLVEPGLATASAHSSLKSIYGSSPGSQLAARHCFVLGNPPDDKKEQNVSESSTATEKIDQNAPELVDQERKTDKEIIHSKENSANLTEEKPIPSVDESPSTAGHTHEKGSKSGDNLKLPCGEQDVCSETSQLAEKLNEGKSQVVQRLDEEKSQVTEKHDEDTSQAAGKPDETTSTEQAGPEVANEPQNFALQNDQSNTNEKDLDDSESKLMPPPSSGNELGNSNAAAEVIQFRDSPKDIDMEPSSLGSDQMEQQEAAQADLMVGVVSETGEDKMDVEKSGDPKSMKTTKTEDDSVAKLKRAALATLSAASVKAKLLANQEEDEIRQLVTQLIEKQLRKLEVKMSYFTEMESAMMRVREQLERSRQKLFNERAQIIASRLGIQGAASRALPSAYPMNRVPPSLLNSMMRPPMMNMVHSQRPPMSRPVATSAPSTTNTSSQAGGTPTQPSALEQPSSVGTN